MTVTTSVSATEAKKNLGSLLRKVREEREMVIVENRREPIAALVSMDDVEELQRLRKEQRIQEARAALLRIAELQAGRNADLSEEDAMELANEAVREIREERRQKLLAFTEGRR